MDQQRSNEIKRHEESIVKKARAELHKVDQVKTKLRATTMSAGVILNQLNTNLEDKLKRIRQANERDFFKNKMD
jgi:hypothetical protein